MSASRAGDLALLQRELTRLAKRGIEQAFDNRKHVGPTPVDVLGRVVAVHSQSLWVLDDSRGNAIRVTLSDAIKRMPRRSSCGAKILWAEAAAILYGLYAFDNSLHILDTSLFEQVKQSTERNSEYEILVKYLSLKARLEKGPTFSRFTRQVRTALAQALLNLEKDGTKRSQSIDGEESTPQGSESQAETVPPGYVRRSSYHEQFKKTLAADTKCIVLAGLPGIGKTSLAEALLAEHGSAAPVIRLRQGRINPQDMELALASIGATAPPKDVWQRPERFLVSLLCQDAAPDFVIFDNAQDFREIDALLPRSVRSTIIVTCNTIGHTLRDHTVIRVGPMVDDEAILLTKVLWPGLRNADAAVLAKALDGYPILIRLACALLVHQPGSVPEFCESIQIEAAALAQTEYMDAGDEKALLVVLRRLLLLIRAEHDLAYEMLVCVAFLDQTPAVDLQFLLDYLGYRLGSKSTTVDHLRAFDVLRRFSILDISQDEIEVRYDSGRIENFNTTWLHMHGLTQRLVQHLVPESEGVTQAMLQVLRTTGDKLSELRDGYGLSNTVKEPTFVDSEIVESPNEIYEKVRAARTRSDLSHVEAGLAKLLETTKQYDNLRMGLLNVVAFRWGMPVCVFDLCVRHRPEDTLEVELYGHRFRLLDIGRAAHDCDLVTATNRVKNPPVKATISRKRIWGPDAERLIPMPCTSILFLDVLPITRSMEIVRETRSDVTLSVIYLGNNV